MTSRVIFFSILPKYAEKILAGTKTVELRRVRPTISKGDIIILYVSSPIKAVKAISIVEDIQCDEIDQLWNVVEGKAGVSRKEYKKYFNGIKTGVAIHMRDIQKFSFPIELSVLRELWHNFNPPQTHRYISSIDYLKLLQLTNFDISFIV